MNRVVSLRNLNFPVLHRSSNPPQEFLFGSRHRERSIAQAIQRLRAFLLNQRVPKPIRPCRVNRKSQSLRNPVQDKLRTALAQDDPPDIGIISHLSGKGHQVTHASAPSSDGYRPTQDPRIFSQRYSSLGKVRAGNRQAFLACDRRPYGADVYVTSKDGNKMTDPGCPLTLNRFPDEPVQRDTNPRSRMDLPPGLRQPVKTHLAVCRKSIVRRLLAATELRSWTTADSGSHCRVFGGSSRQCLTSCTSSV